MKGRFTQFPSYLADRARTYKFGDIPVLLAHPDWESPAPTVIWLHGRTANKELDPGRYLRWIRAGIAACAIDLPGHGERVIPEYQTGQYSPTIIRQAVGEIDQVLAALSAPEFKHAFDTARSAIGGMSLGGMVALRRLCDPHPFKSAAVEATTGDLSGYFRRAEANTQDPETIRAVDPMQHLATWRPLPLLALHSEADRLVPVASMRTFIENLRAHYAAHGADPGLVALRTWPETGAPDEHIGFGRVSNDAKNLQTDFFKRTLA